ncbi:hypothetical protein MKA58_11060 [[Clostridium] innocuum]|nr:hypothetical protein [[Clostridium] innocuum]
MKHKLAIIGTCIGLFICSSCENRDEEIKMNSQTAVEFTGYIQMDDGIYYSSSMDNQPYMCFFDKKSKKKVPVCQKPNCKHNDMNCSAFQLGTYKDSILQTFTFYKNRLYLYYIGKTNNQNDVIMTADLDGNNRKEWFQVPDNSLINQSFIYQDMMFISYNVLGEIDDYQTGVISTQLYVYDMNENTEKLIDKTESNKDSFLVFIGFQDGKAYYIESDIQKEQKPIYEYDLKTKKTKCINYENTIETSMLYQQTLLYADQVDKKIKAYDIFEKKDTVLAELPEHEGKLVQSSSDGIVRLNYVVNPGTSSSVSYFQAYDAQKKDFVYPKFQKGIDLFFHLWDGYFGTVKFEFAVFDEQMKYVLLD